jgi:hypothetical protein
VLLALTLMLAAAVRIRGLASMPLWMDERFTLGASRLGFLDMIRAGDIVHPPVYPLMSHAALLLGEGEWLIRLPALAGGLLGILVVFGILRALGYRGTAHAGALLTALSVYHVYYSQEARGYTWMSALTGLTLLLAIRYVSRPRPLLLAGALTTSILACLFHYLGGVSSACLVLALAVFDVTRGLEADTRRSMTGAALVWLFFLAMGATVMVFLGENLIVFAGTLLKDPTTGLNVGPRFAAEHVGRWVGVGGGWGRWALAALAIGAIHALYKSPRRSGLVVLAALGPFAVFAAIPWVNAWEARYLTSAFVPVIVLCVLGFRGLAGALAFALHHRFSWSWRTTCIAVTVALTPFALRVGSATLHYASAPSKVYPLWTTTDFHLEHLFLQSRVDPWLIRSRSELDFNAEVDRDFGPALVPVPDWDATNNMRILAGPCEESFRMQSSRYLTNTRADEAIRVRVSRSRQQSRQQPRQQPRQQQSGNEGIEDPVCASSFIAEVSPRRLRSTGNEAHLVQFGRAAGRGFVAFQQVSWYCAEQRVQIDVMIRSPRLRLARRYLDEVLDRARCTPALPAGQSNRPGEPGE